MVALDLSQGFGSRGSCKVSEKKPGAAIMSNRDDHCWPKLSWWHSYENIFKSKNYAYQVWEWGLGKIWMKQPLRNKVLQAQEQIFPAAAARGEHYSDADCPSAGSRGLRCSRYPHCSLWMIPRQSRWRRPGGNCSLRTAPRMSSCQKGKQPILDQVFCQDPWLPKGSML